MANARGGRVRESRACLSKGGATLVAELRSKATALGFDLCRVTAPDQPPGVAEGLAQFLELGRHGDMSWMETTRVRRGDPRTLWPEVRACVMLAMNYAPDRDPRASLENRGAGAISVYARHRDYHDVMKGKLKQLASWLVARAGGDVKVFVDTAPVMEKPLAQSAGVGWQGKHTNLVSRDYGSWLFLGVLFTDVELPAEAPESDRCGACRACLDACPTNAFPAPYQLDARRCISYLTIEHKGPIPFELRPSLGNRIYGCDDCLAVCPWNKFARAAREAKLVAPQWRDPPLGELARLDDAAFRARFSGSPIKRIGRDRFLRNVLIAIGNSGAPELAASVRPHLTDSSPIVRGAAIWSLGRLAPDETPPTTACCDPDPDVREEWRRAFPGK